MTIFVDVFSKSSGQFSPNDIDLFSEISEYISFLFFVLVWKKFFKINISRTHWYFLFLISRINSGSCLQSGNSTCSKYVVFWKFSEQKFMKFSRSTGFFRLENSTKFLNYVFSPYFSKFSRTFSAENFNLSPGQACWRPYCHERGKISPVQ